MEASTIVCSGVFTLLTAAKKSGTPSGILRKHSLSILTVLLIESGGDRYNGCLKSPTSGISSEVDIYIPQEISRRERVSPLTKVMMKVCTVAEVEAKGSSVEAKELEVSSDALFRESSVLVKLTSLAKSSGGDRYEGTLSLASRVNVYIRKLHILLVHVISTRSTADFYYCIQLSASQELCVAVGSHNYFLYLKRRMAPIISARLLKLASWRLLSLC
jgi:hypothetical protein